MIRKTLIICALSASSFITTAVAEQSPTRVSISDDVVKIGVLNDMSSLYSDATGKGSLTAAQMAVADFGGSVRGKPITGILACCAPAASGHAAAPPSSDMNSRLIIRSPRRQARAVLVGAHSLFMAFGDGLAPLVRIWRNLYRGLMSI